MVEAHLPIVAKGVITDDPLLDLPAGSRLEIRTVAPSADLLDVASPPPLSWFEGALLQLHVGDREHGRVVGSAAMVAPGLAITAKHVLDEEMPKIMSCELAIYATAISASGLDIWQPRHIAFQPETDLAIIAMERRSPLTDPPMLYQASLSTRLPPVGEVMLICGFRSGELVNTFARDEPQFGGEFRIAAGRVTEDRFPTGRDRLILPWPTFFVDVETTRGMSGGPVFDKFGKMVGVLCRSLGDKDAGIPSYVSMIYPALCVEFEASWPPGIYRQKETLLRLSGTHCAIEGGEKLIRHVDANGAGAWTYEPWE